MKVMPKIQKYMTPMPHTVGIDMQVSKAWEMMKEHRIRHLPVLDGGKLKGMLSDRDIKLAASFTGGDKLKVEEVMTPDPYTVSPDAALDEVVREMASKKYGSAIVAQDNGKVVGIFTEIDVMTTLDEVLRGNFRTG